MSAKEITSRLKYVSKQTKHVQLRGLVSKYPLEKYKNVTLTSAILHQLKIKCPHLESLAIHEGMLNFKKVRGGKYLMWELLFIHVSRFQMSLMDFPVTLKRLSFNGCEILHQRPQKLFHKIDNHLQLLEELSLENCRWFETHDLFVFSKLPNLKKLCLRGCVSLKESVPYCSIATRFGFRKLEVR